jgi:hypothetical protein
MENIKQPHPSRKAMTPLWIVALFVSLTEAVLGVAVTQTNNGVQIALTAFVIFFPLLIAGAFFLILWNRPYVFYPPTEFGQQVDVTQYVDAMKRQSIDENKIYKNIKETVTSSLLSPEIVNKLVETISQGTNASMPVRVKQILDSAADKAVEGIRNAGFLTIDSTPLLKEKGKIWQEPYNEFQSVKAFLDRMWYSLDPHIDPHTYGDVWILRDQKSGHVFGEITSSWALKHNIDRRKQLLKDVGIIPGTSLEIVPFKNSVLT